MTTDRNSRPRLGRRAVGVGLAALLLGAVFVAGVALGSTPVPFATVARVLAAHLSPAGWVDLSAVGEGDQAIVWLLRVPRVLTAAFVGASLAVAGVQLQGLFRNPLASPDVIGASSGGAFGAVLALASGLAGRSLFYLPLLSFVGTAAALFLVYAIATRRGRTPVAPLLLAGVAVNALLGAATSFVISVKWVRFEVAQEIVFWLMGGLDSRTWDHVGLIAPCFAGGLAVAVRFARELDGLLLGEETALSVGIEVEQVKRMVLAGAALLTGGAVAVSGVIGFVGLVVPHVVRLVVGPKHGALLPASAFAGAAFVIAADLAARTVVRPTELRLGIVAAAVGAPFFLYQLLRQQHAVGGE